MSLVILTLIIYNFIQNSEQDKCREELQEYQAKFEGSIEFLKDYKNAIDSVIQQKDDSIALLLKQIEKK